MNAVKESLLEKILVHIETQGAANTIALLREEMDRLVAIQRILEKRSKPTPAAQLVNQERDALVGEIKTLQANLDIAVQALRFYAEQTTYFYDEPSVINSDCGARARNALATLVSSCPVDSVRDEGQSDG